jgi:hypothetical protein
MEVHAHTHTERKKWTHYLWEFLMLFLAVFCGFLAENYRERLTDREKERQYMESMVKDLQRDTAFLKTGFSRKEERVKAIDSVFDFFELHQEPHEIPGYMAVVMKRTSWDRIYDRSSGTINQLKNAGGLRLIKNKNVSDSIAAYDLLWERDNFWKQNYITLQQINLSLTEKIFNPYDFLHIYRAAGNGPGTASLLRQLALVRINTASIDEFLNFLSRQKAWTLQDYQFYKNMTASAVRLIELIKKEYHLK